MSDYVTVRNPRFLPRIPLEGSIDLTYRCNNSCRHCWTCLPQNASETEKELPFDEIRRMAEEARAMGCRRWNISGGEPMLRPDFSEIFDCLTSRSAGYSLNTNGTLITPAIAQLMKRKGSKMVALFGATAEVHDHITRRPGSFEEAMQGIACLREAGAGFTVQLVPMRDNWHQWDAMVELAGTLSPHWRVGAAWLYLSACGSPQRNAEIAAQRLDPRDVVSLDPPDMSNGNGLPATGRADEAAIRCGSSARGDDRLFAACIETRRDFHIDPYGGMSFCGFITDPSLRFSLREGTFHEGWEQFIPSLAESVRGGPEYRENCGVCESRSDCRWCGAYGYLERQRHSASVPYLCAVARESRLYKENRQRNHRRYYRIAGITIRVEADLPIKDATFSPALRTFEVDGAGEDTITIRHHFEIPGLNERDLGVEVYRKAPWSIRRKNNTWFYLGLSLDPADDSPHQVAVLNGDHTRAEVYSDNGQLFGSGNLPGLTMFPTDQILLARVLADRQGCYLHSAGMIVEGRGLLFVGHSEAGKSTAVKLLRHRGEILCDDRVIVRRWPDGFRIHGTWSHGEIPDVSSASAPLRAVLFLKKSDRNRITPLEDRRIIIGMLLGCLIKPLVTADWWDKTFDVVETLAREAMFYEMEFDRSGAIVPLLVRCV